MTALLLKLYPFLADKEKITDTQLSLPPRKEAMGAELFPIAPQTGHTHSYAAQCSDRNLNTPLQAV